MLPHQPIKTAQIMFKCSFWLLLFCFNPKLYFLYYEGSLDLPNIFYLHMMFFSPLQDPFQ
jgi:hypothetical protein